MIKDPKFTPQEANQIIQDYIEKQSASKYDAIKKEGADFLAENAKRPTVKTTSSGLQYEIITEGKAQNQIYGLRSNRTISWHLNKWNCFPIAQWLKSACVIWRYTSNQRMD
ncbi:MAG: FKBP-type peptidyl-prolyl cis-trans isomerase N-terminal domain-containing protein [Crocinitomicaceae bacterium]|nr:FKBP-type peptidyl-prolyl cis-trans isomerase N-terminal domain-containing protein [Crocinitomicaceae bacterium]